MVQNVMFVADDAVEQPFVGRSAHFTYRDPPGRSCQRLLPSDTCGRTQLRNPAYQPPTSVPQTSADYVLGAENNTNITERCGAASPSPNHGGRGLLPPWPNSQTKRSEHSRECRNPRRHCLCARGLDLWLPGPKINVMFLWHVVDHFYVKVCWS